MTFGSAAAFAGNPAQWIFDHEYGHTLEFILMSLAGKNPWVPYLALGVAGWTWESEADGLIPLIGCGFENGASALGGAEVPPTEQRRCIK